MSRVAVYVGDSLKRYGFGSDHPLNQQRLGAFWQAMQHSGLAQQVIVCEPVQAEQLIIERFHEHDYVERVKAQSRLGSGFLDYGDTPAFPGIYEAAATVVGCAVDATEKILAGTYQRAFVPIGGLHHARRDTAAGFCVFNDCGVVIETLLKHHQLTRIAYIDIDAHHGDGVFYAFETEPSLYFVDVHEDGRYLYPGTGSATEIGQGIATGTKLNIPLLPYAKNETFKQAWNCAENFIVQAEPEFIIFQCGADSLAGDPITHLEYTFEAHAYAAQRLCVLANRYCAGRILGLGGGGYHLENLATAWTAVVAAFLESGLSA
ncbi:MAG: acetoin utilization protein AcuC [Thioploca sp.]|nr:acetoin utilization protein AcuC [Thioploca sp.]